MKSKLLIAGILVLLPALVMAEKEGSESAWKGSVAVTKKVSPLEFPALAKLSLQSAMQTALKAVPGSVLKAEMEVENGSLIYSFDIATKDKKIMEVIVDAGTGKVLLAAEDNEEAESKDGKEKDKEGDKD